MILLPLSLPSMLKRDMCSLVFPCILLLVAIIAMKPPTEPPEALVDDYTLYDQVELELYYVDDSNAGEGSHYKFGQKYIDKLISQSIPDQLESLRKKGFGPIEDQHPGQEHFDSMLLQLLDKRYWPLVALSHMQDSLKGKKVAVFGSIDPYFECVALYFGAKSVTTFEYNQLTFEDDRLHVVTSERYNDLVEAAEQDELDHPDYAHYHHYFDTALSFSSFDHSGLGRYGDPLDPYGDLNAMAFVKKILKNNGKCIFTLPIGPDVTVWNLHRRYGHIRLPMMIEAFYNGAELAIDSYREGRESGGGGGGMEMEMGAEDVLEEAEEAASNANAAFHDHLAEYWPHVLTVGWYPARLSQEASWTQTYEPILVLPASE